MLRRATPGGYNTTGAVRQGTWQNIDEDLVLDEQESEIDDTIQIQAARMVPPPYPRPQPHDYETPQQAGEGEEEGGFVGTMGASTAENELGLVQRTRSPSPGGSLT